jgi:4-hydroxy-tetrahydrodipicolinate synthase
MPRQQPYVASAGLVAYWEAIIEAGGLPSVVYQRGLPHRDDLTRLLSHELVVGCKYAEPDVAGFAAAVAADTSGVGWTCGIAERYAPFFASAGSIGFTSGLANVAPRLPLAMQEALRRNDLSLALSIREACLPLEVIRTRHGDAYNVSAVKAAMDAIGLAGGRVRPPLVDLDSDTAVEIEAVAKALLTTSEEYR